MNHNYILVEHRNDLNDLILKPIQQSQRIKFTCFDVSTNHIVFGANSGGIYIFKRKPCVFLKIVPTKEGVLDRLSISDDEYYVAVSNLKGLIVIIENCFTGSEIKFQIYNQHENNKITVLRWHLHELYSGDIYGKVCTTAFKNVLKKSKMFQVPFAVLMHLDSSIVQIDCYLQYLLVSTLTKTLLCDTAHEQYKQIGRKLRDGPHGACFQNLPEERFNSHFNIRQEAHSSAITDVSKEVGIFCTRPGLRLWQVDFDTSVICTHQLKNAKPLGKDIYKITEDKNCRVQKDNASLYIDNDGTNNFYKLYLLRCNLMLTFNDLVVYILRVIENKVTLLHKLIFSSTIRDVRVVDDNFYVLLETWVLKCYSIFNLENFILHALNMEQYLLCADICADFKESIYYLYDKSENLQSLCTLKLNLQELDELHFLDDLDDLFEFIDLKNKTITVNRNGPTENANSISVITQNDSAEGIIESANKAVEVNMLDDGNFCVSVLIKQYKLNQQYHVDYPVYIQLLEHKSVLEIMSLFESINIEEPEFDIDRKDFINWCSKQFLNLVTIDLTSDKLLKDYAIKCFRNINKSADDICMKCNYPLPTAKDNIPLFYHLVCDILKHDDAFILRQIATEVPYVWKCLLERDAKLDSINKLLPVIVQFSDIAVLEQYAHKLDYDMWDEAVRLLVKIKSRRCLYCDSKLDMDIASTISWQAFANVAMRAMGPTCVLGLFKTHKAFISNADLGVEFYQNFMFIAVMDNAGENRGMSTKTFQSAMRHKSQKIEIEGSLVKYLNNAFLQRNNHSHLDISTISSIKNFLSNKLEKI